MIKNILTVLFTTVSTILLFAQQKSLPNNQFQQEFNQAYQQYPDVPRGVLEAVAFTNTRFQHLKNTQESCTEIPLAYGVMGLTLDGKNYFRNNLNYVAQLSGFSVNDILQNPSQHILGYAAAYQNLLNQSNFDKTNIENHGQILATLSELPYDGLTQDFALNSHLYSVFNFLTDVDAQKKYQFPNHNISLSNIFGEENLAILSSSKIVISENTISTSTGKLYSNSGLGISSVDYPPALTNLTTCNFSSRGVAVSAVTVHTIQGSYAGAISWANNCTSNVSYHYVLRSSDGQVTQVVLESNKAWHVGSENPYTIGMEHEGYVNNPAWYTVAMYQSSADVVRDITQSGYGISPLRTAYFPWAPTTNYNASSIPGSCVKIKGHQHFPNQSHTDPGANWDWDYYYKLINNTTPIITNTNLTGTVTDLGGTGNYGNDERMLFLIQPTGATSINLNFTAFDMENTWDYVYIYNGTTPFSSLVGFYTGATLPNTINVNSGNVLIEYRTDCSTTKPGFVINWTSLAPDAIKPTTAISAAPNPASTDFTSTFSDADNVGGSGILHQFYQVIDNDGVEWRANNNNGFFSDNFDAAIHADWITVAGSWNIAGAYLVQADDTLTNTNIYAAVNQNTYNKYLYHWEGKLEGAGTNRRAGFHFYSDNASLDNRGNSYFVWFRLDNDKIQIYKVVNDTFALEQDVSYNFNASTFYDFKVTFDKIAGNIDVFVNDVFKATWQDASPHSTGGDFVSFRSGNAIYTVNNLKIYHSRSSSALVTVGNGPTYDIRYEGTPAGKIKSVVIDNAKNVSTIAEELVNVDWLNTSIAKNDVVQASIYPNPVQNELMVVFSEPITQGKYAIVDVTGKEVFAASLMKTQQQKIDVSALSSGLYFLNIVSESYNENIRFVKE